MEHICFLLEMVKAITLKDISDLPPEHQHAVALRLEELHEELNKALVI